MTDQHERPTATDTGSPATENGTSSPGLLNYAFTAALLILLLAVLLVVSTGGMERIIPSWYGSTERQKTNGSKTGNNSPSIPAPYHQLQPPAPRPETIQSGKQIYRDHCIACHGERGAGKGPVSTGLDPEPQSFSTTDFIDRTPDSYLFWRISEGKPGTAMPAFKSILSRKQRWWVIHYLHRISEDG